MDLLFKILMAVFACVSVVSGIYNIVSSKSTAQELAQKAKIDQALALSVENKKDIQHLKDQIDRRDKVIDKRLDQISDDTGWLRDLFTKKLLDAGGKS